MTESEKLERKELMQKLRELNIKFSPNSGIDTLRAKYEAAFNSGSNTSAASISGSSSESTVLSGSEENTSMKSEIINPKSAFEKAWQENMKLIRCSIRNNNPNKEGMHGEIITFANPIIGKVSKYVPWDEAGNSYHIPVCIYKILKRRKYLSINSRVDRNSGRIIVERTFKPEFTLEILPPLTTEELNELKKRQLARTQLAEQPELQ